MTGNQERLDKKIDPYIKTVSSILLDGSCTIADTNESRPLRVGPSPELAEKMKKEVEKIRKGNKDSVLSNLLTARERSPPGMNDGLIYPGDLYPLGTSAGTVRTAALDRAPVRGTVRVIVVLVEFSDKKMTQTKKHFEDLFFSTGVIPTGSVKEYYREASNNLVDFTGEVAGPFLLPKKLSEYAHGASGTGSTSPNARTMAKDAAVAANPTVNYAPYDNNADGFIDAFIVIHAGKGAEQTGSPNDIWSHKWVLEGGAYNADGTKIYAYITVPEDSKTGVCCHELGHLIFGFPDLYDTDYSSEGIGNWCLMAGGSWNGSGDIPAQPSAWCKANQEWVTVVNQTSKANVSIPQVETSHTIFRLSKNGQSGKEFFLIENRQKTLFDRKLPGDGLLIWHIDENIATNSDENHPKVALEQADNKKELEAGINRGNAGDPYPGSSNNTAFTSISTPGSKSYGGVDTCVSVTNISASAPTMTAGVSVSCGPKLAKESKKELLKDQVKEFTKAERKEMKEFSKIERKEIKEIDKNVKEIDKRKDNEGWPGGFGSHTGYQRNEFSIESRIEALESQMGAIEPFIDAHLRPDLREGALIDDDEIRQMNNQMQGAAITSKRYFDSKPTRE